MSEENAQAIEDDVRFFCAVYQEVVKGERLRAEARIKELLSKTNPETIDIADIENPEEPLSPSAWSLQCYQSSFEDEVIQNDLFNRLSEEAKLVLRLLEQTPEEFLADLKKISVKGETGCPKNAQKVSHKRLLKRARLAKFFKHIFSPREFSRIWWELEHYFHESMV